MYEYTVRKTLALIVTYCLLSFDSVPVIPLEHFMHILRHSKSMTLAI